MTRRPSYLTLADAVDIAYGPTRTERGHQMDETIPNKALCPPLIMEALNAWANTARPPGYFVEAVLRNDLREAVGRADPQNCAALPHIVAYAYNQIPAACWGSVANMEAWAELKRGGDQ